MSETVYHIYVDGSYIYDSIGYGAVILKEGQVEKEMFGPVREPNALASRQVGGELTAVMEALKWCQANQVTKVHLFYDYTGLEHWATGKWQANKELTQNYALMVRECPVKVVWHKVKSHSGDQWNDRVDQLAKQGALQDQEGADSPKPTSSKTVPSPTVKQPNNRQKYQGEDLMPPLAQRAKQFELYLISKGFEARFDNIYNQQYARIIIGVRHERLGIFDLYHTRKKPFSPYLNNFTNPKLEAKIQYLWNEYCNNI